MMRHTWFYKKHTDNDKKGKRKRHSSTVNEDLDRGTSLHMQFKRRGSYTETGRQELGSVGEKYKSFIYFLYFLYWP